MDQKVTNTRKAKFNEHLLKYKINIEILNLRKKIKSKMHCKIYRRLA